MHDTQLPAPPVPPLDVVLLGYGLAGQAFHAPFIDAVPGLRLRTVVTGRADRAAEARTRYPGVEVVARADDALARAHDLAVVATPNALHAPLATQALEAGCAVVVDKPFAPTSAAAAAVAARAEALGLPLAVYQNRRWDDDLLTVQALLAAGRLGTVHRFESRFERWRPTPSGGWRERAEPGQAPGLLFDLGSHLVDQARVLFGPVTTVYAQCDVRRTGAEVDDDTFIALTHAGGVRSHLWAGSLVAAPGPRLRVLGDVAAYEVHGMDPQEAALRSGTDPRAAGFGVRPVEDAGLMHDGVGTTTAVPTVPGRYLTFYEHMERAVRTGAPVPVPADQALAALRVVEAAARSAVSGEVVHLDGQG